MKLFVGNLPFYKIQVNHFMAREELSGAILNSDIPFFSLTDCQWLYNLQLKNRGGVVFFLPPSDAYVRSFLYLLYTLIKLYHTKALSDPVSSLAPDWIRQLVITFLPRSRRLLISLLQSTSAVILEPQKIKSVTVSTIPHVFAMKWWDQMPWS